MDLNLPMDFVIFYMNQSYHFLFCIAMVIWLASMLFVCNYVHKAWFPYNRLSCKGRLYRLIAA